MRNLIIVLTSLVITWSILVHARAAHAQDVVATTSTVSTTSMKVEWVPGQTDICTRIDASTIQCTRLKKGEKPTTFTVTR